MAKKPDIAAALRKARTAAPEPEPADRPAGGRAGKVGLTVYIDPAVRLQLKVLAAEENVSVQKLVFEGLNMLFAARHRPEIAR